MYAYQSEAPTRRPITNALATPTPDRVKTAPERLAVPPTANRLLAKLPEADYQRLAPQLEPVAFPVGRTIHEVGECLKYAYFPTKGVFSRCSQTSDGTSFEIAVTSNEGLIGISLYMGAQHSTWRAVAQSPGHAYRLPAELLLEEFERGGHFQHLLLRYAQTMMIQVAQTVACYRHHSIEQQFCRVLLGFLDRMAGDQINMTQEMIANLIGVRREGVTEAAGHLRSAGVIAYRRGLIVVLDRPALEKRVCECYAVVRRELEGLL